MTSKSPENPIRRVRWSAFDRPHASPPQRSSSPLHQPLRASHQNPHHRAHPVHLRRAPPMCRPSLPDALQPLGRAWASAGAAMHPALPAGHRWCPARLASSGSGATSRGGLSQGQCYSPIGHAPLGVFRQLRSHPYPSPTFTAGWTLPTSARPPSCTTTLSTRTTCGPLPRFRSRASSMSVMPRARFAPSFRSFDATSGC